jgi:DNA-binding transcriptional LysR family regulator
VDDRAVFVAVADAGSFAGAARQLGVARSTVLRRVAALEEELALVLVHRAGPRIALSEAGRRYAEQLRPLLRELHRVEEEVRQQGAQLTGSLRLWLPVLGTTVGVAAALAEFRAAHPGVRLVVEVGEAASHSVGDFDIALQVGLRRNPSFRAKTLYTERLLIVAAPAYLERRGLPRLGELAHHEAIVLRDAEGRVPPWRLPDGTPVSPPPAALAVNAVGFAHHLAVLGQGLARVPRTLASPELASGRLVQVLPEVWVEEPVSFLFPGKPGPVARAFLDVAGAWLATHFGP